jgi:hypothetical protein
VVRVLVTLAVLIAIAVVAWLFYQVATLSIYADNARRAEASAKIDRDRLAAAVQDQGVAIAEANRQLVAAGKKPVTVPAPTALPKISPELVAAAVSAYMAAHPVRDGRNAPDAATVVRAVMPAVQAQVAAYQAAHPAKNGTNGKDGAAGVDGKDGATGPAGPAGKDGTDAPPPTQEQVDAAVTAYCDAHDHCQGPAGATGPAGKDGQDAYPFTFTFVVQDNPVQSTTYTCTITDPAVPATCTKAQ